MASSEAKEFKRQWRVKKKIGKGAFGEVFLGLNRQTGQYVAIKMEDQDTEHPQLAHEARFYKSLKGGEGIGEVFWNGDTGDGHYAVVMDLLGPSLEELFNCCDHHISLPTVISIAQTLMSRFEFIHNRGIIHRDIKPHNFLCSSLAQVFQQDTQAELFAGIPSDLYVIDFGLARAYNTSTGHIPLKKHQGRAGTARYASINTHKALSQSRRDDLESIGYLLVYLHKGRLPWQGIKASNRRDKHLRICDVKVKTPLQDLCKGMPEEFVTYLEYVRGLGFDEQPDYAYLKGLFTQLWDSHDEAPADWCKLPCSSLTCMAALESFKNSNGIPGNPSNSDPGSAKQSNSHSRKRERQKPSKPREGIDADAKTHSSSEGRPRDKRKKKNR